MNSKFFDVKKDKQDAIINAALKIFTLKGYRDASTDVIVRIAGISKGLLFHYFTSKQGLYEFICDYSSRYMILELTRTVKKSEKDIFGLMAQISQARVRVMKNYPFMPQFLKSLKLEDDPEAVSAMGTCREDLDITYRNIYEKIDSGSLVKPDELDKVIKVIDWVCDGFLRENFMKDDPQPDALYETYSQYLTMLRDHFYASAENERVSIAKEEVNERNETVMKEMRMDMTFEERLMAGKKPLVESEEEEEPEEADNGENPEAEDEPEDDSTPKESETFDDIIKEAEKNISSISSGQN
ncbi:MAG: TetR/AcrR family transcriptional regulator [Lachnospiraceae bacterium]|nr:TetR/AcrR family transcriptional regulator [Lachnospiraceae bacterium]